MIAEEKKEKIKEDEAERKRQEQELEDFFRIIKVITPGTRLRAAIDDIVKARLGALIVLDDSPEVLKIVHGGFKIDSRFTPQKLLELCKVDGALILSENCEKIVYCNTLLTPNTEIETSETGTRHMAAERTTKQTNRPVVAVSERRGTATLYYKNIRHVLRQPEELLSKAAELLRMLEKHKEILDQLFVSLNILEFTSIVNLQDVILCIQRTELMSRIAETIGRYIVELGNEGNLIEIMLKEIMKSIEGEKELLLRDYSQNWEFTKTVLPILNLDEILDAAEITRTLFYSNSSDSVMPFGYRILAKTSLHKETINQLIEHFKNFQNILTALESSEQQLTNVIGEKDTKKLIKELISLREQSLVGKKI